MTEHPITPPLELVEQLRSEAPHGIRDAGVTRERQLAIAAYRAGADAELEACCALIGSAHVRDMVRAARRPNKPPSLAEQATAKLDEAVMRGDCITTTYAMPILRRALERLQELEGNG